jgi:flavin-dependent dehydrogenase
VEAVDVAVIGAGPAGSTLAALLAARGVSVALIDRDDFPRDKLCGEFLSYDALPIAAALGVDLGDAPHITRCRVVGRHRSYEFDFPHAARGVSRMFLDDALHRRAVAAGAHAVTANAAGVSPEGVSFDGGVVRARVGGGGGGGWGRFDQQLERRFVRDRAHRNFGFKRHYRSGRDPSAIELYSFGRGYLGVSNVERGVTNVCGLVHASRLAHHKGRWDSFVETIRAEEPRLDAMFARVEAAQEEFLSSEPVIFRARSAVEGGIFMIGDASGVIDPLTGNGMAMAMQSALLAAPYIVEALAARDRTRVEDAYRARHHHLFAHRIAWSRRVAALLSRPALLDAALVVRKAGPLFLRKTRGKVEEIERLLEQGRGE